MGERSLGIVLLELGLQLPADENVSREMYAME
jgi:hypothetical protein